MALTENESAESTSPWQLHLRKAKGESLTGEEQQQLADWYACQEQKERASLRLIATGEETAPLQHQIDAMLDKIAVTTAQIQTLTKENRQLRQEIVRLEQQLAQQRTLQPA